MIKNIKNILFFLLGITSLAIGILGIILPVLPGMPFFLFASFCFAKGSKRIEKWFKGTTFYENYVEGFRQNKGMTRREKLRINIIADTFILFSILYVDFLLVKLILILLAFYKHYYFIKKVKTIDYSKTTS